MGRIWLRLLISCLIGAAFLAAVAKQIDVVPTDLSIEPWALPAYAVSLVGYVGLRAGRWVFLVRPLTTASWTRITHVAMAGAMWTTLLPFRLGELSRPLLMARTTDVGMAPALGAVAIERVVDGLVVCGLFFLVAGGSAPAGEYGEALFAGANVVVGIFATGLVGLVLMARFPLAMGKLVDATVGRVLPAFGRKLADVASGVSQGLAALPNVMPLLWFLLVTAAYWAANAGGVYLLAAGCGVDLGLAQSAAFVAIVSLGLLVPAGPGNLGTFQGAGLVALAAFLPPDVVAGRGGVFLFWLYVMQLGGIVLGGIVAHRSLQVEWKSVLPGAGTGDREPGGSPS